MYERVLITGLVPNLIEILEQINFQKLYILTNKPIFETHKIWKYCSIKKIEVINFSFEETFIINYTIAKTAKIIVDEKLKKNYIFSYIGAEGIISSSIQIAATYHNEKIEEMLCMYGKILHRLPKIETVKPNKFINRSAKLIFEKGHATYKELIELFTDQLGYKNFPSEFELSDDKRKVMNVYALKLKRAISSKIKYFEKEIRNKTVHLKLTQEGIDLACLSGLINVKTIQVKLLDGIVVYSCFYCDCFVQEEQTHWNLLHTCTYSKFCCKTCGHINDCKDLKFKKRK